ncbi:MAG: DsbA family protein [Pseudomonadota bacterium]
MKQIFFLLLLPFAMLSGPATAQSESTHADADVPALAADQRDLLREEIRAYLLEHPEVILEAIELLEERRESAATNADRALVASHSEAIFNDGYSHVGGNPEGDVTLVEFIDYRCGFCRRAHPEINELVETDPNLRVVVKEFPILGPESVAVGRMALAALEIDSDRYGALSDALMEHQGDLTETAGYLIAKQAGFNVSELKEAAQSETVAERLSMNYQLAQALGLQGTPSFILGGEIIRGYIPLAEMRDRISEARAGAGAADQAQN